MAPAPFDSFTWNPTFDAAPRVEGEPFILFCPE
jgi:hypothetical protein